MLYGLIRAEHNHSVVYSLHEALTRFSAAPSEGDFCLFDMEGNYVFEENEGRYVVPLPGNPGNDLDACTRMNFLNDASVEIPIDSYVGAVMEHIFVHGVSLFLLILGLW